MCPNRLSMHILIYKQAVYRKGKIMLRSYLMKMSSTLTITRRGDNISTIQRTEGKKKRKQKNKKNCLH